MKLVVAVIVSLLSIFSIYSQGSVTGKVITTLGKPVQGASVTISSAGSGGIMDYDISDMEGLFDIPLKSETGNSRLHVRAIGFKFFAKEINNRSQFIEIILEEEITELKEVVVEGNPIIRKGDTINYAIGFFAKQQDRTLADVLDNLPGLEVLSDGRILYQGNPINKYYIEGLDLLGGKYNLANKNLPYNVVSKVQVLENHQPIKLLDSLVASNSAAINIKLKNRYTVTGQMEAGTGISPMLWNLAFTPMLFSKTKQALGSYQTNNTGEDVSKQLKTLTIEELIDQLELDDQKWDWLAIQQLQPPNFSERRWLDNNVHLLTANYLQKVKNDYELRLNVSYLNDFQRQNGSSDTKFYTPNDTIELFEQKNNRLYTNTLKTELKLYKNTSGKYVRNNLAFEGFWDGQSGLIDRSESMIDQHLRNSFFNLSNNLKALVAVNKQILTLNSYSSLRKTPQRLRIRPGQFNALLYNNIPAEETVQFVENKRFLTNNSLEYTKRLKKFTINPKLGFLLENQHLSSALGLPDQSSEFENNLDWRHTKFYLQMFMQYKRKRWTLDITTPLNIRYFELQDVPLGYSQNLDRITFEPKVSLNYQFGKNWKLIAAVDINNDFGRIQQAYTNYILQDYRNLKRISGPLPMKNNTEYAAYVKYRNPIRSEFLSFAYSYNRAERNLLYQSQILENGAIEFQAIEQENERGTHHFSTRLSKYISKISTNASVNASYGLQNYQQVLNTTLTDISVRNWGFGAKVDTDFTPWLNTEFQGNIQLIKNEIQQQSSNFITQQSYFMGLNTFPIENHTISFTAEMILNDLFDQRTENIFGDVSWRFSWPKKDVDFELQWYNMFNTKTYSTVYISEFNAVETNFGLRPSQVLFKIRFSL